MFKMISQEQFDKEMEDAFVDGKVYGEIITHMALSHYRIRCEIPKAIRGIVQDMADKKDYMTSYKGMENDKMVYFEATKIDFSGPAMTRWGGKEDVQ